MLKKSLNLSLVLTHKIFHERAREVVQWFRAFSILPEDPDSILSIQLAAFNCL